MNPIDRAVEAFTHRVPLPICARSAAEHFEHGFASLVGGAGEGVKGGMVLEPAADHSTQLRPSMPAVTLQCSGAGSRRPLLESKRQRGSAGWQHTVNTRSGGWVSISGLCNLDDVTVCLHAGSGICHLCTAVTKKSPLSLFLFSLQSLSCGVKISASLLNKL